MSSRKTINSVTLLLLATISLTLSGCKDAPLSEELVLAHPSVSADSVRPENLKVMCPFIRMLERSGLLDEELAASDTNTVTKKTLTDAAYDFGCGSFECGGVIAITSSNQDSTGVDIERLHDAKSVSHDCGLTFGLGDTEVNVAVRQSTLDSFAALADSEGNLVYSDLETVKLDICAAQGVEMTSTGELELKLMFAYLGGVENGSIPLSGVVSLLHATMPDNKTTEWVNASLLGAVE